ncbi:unnamed protein product, partial [Vitis vinifera]|uniref:Uncharacterized protein n=1 Tax=Vitis vinifera TaxID=29760 RepID=D7SQB9_VITVI
MDYNMYLRYKHNKTSKEFHLIYIKGWQWGGFFRVSTPPIMGCVSILTK